MKNIIFFVLLGMIFTNILQAQTAIHIVDATTEKNIPFATVKIGQQYFFADENGRLKVESSLEQAEIEVDQIGYEPRLLQLTDQLAGQIQIQLQPRSILLEEILVSDAKRNITAQSTVLQDEAKMVSQPRDIGDLLRNQTGFGIIKKGDMPLIPFSELLNTSNSILFMMAACKQCMPARLEWIPSLHTSTLPKLKN